MEGINWMEIIMVAAPVLVTAIAGFINQGGKLNRIMHAVDQTDDVTAAVVNAMKDGKLTKEEVELIAREADEARQAWSNL